MLSTHELSMNFTTLIIFPIEKLCVYKIFFVILQR